MAVGTLLAVFPGAPSQPHRPGVGPGAHRSELRDCRERPATGATRRWRPDPAGAGKRTPPPTADPAPTRHRRRHSPATCHRGRRRAGRLHRRAGHPGDQGDGRSDGRWSARPRRRSPAPTSTASPSTSSRVRGELGRGQLLRHLVHARAAGAPRAGGLRRGARRRAGAGGERGLRRPARRHPGVLRPAAAATGRSWPTTPGRIALAYGVTGGARVLSRGPRGHGGGRVHPGVTAAQLDAAIRLHGGLDAATGPTTGGTEPRPGGGDEARRVARRHRGLPAVAEVEAEVAPKRPCPRRRRARDAVARPGGPGSCWWSCCRGPARGDHRRRRSRRRRASGRRRSPAPSSARSAPGSPWPSPTSWRPGRSVATSPSDRGRPGRRADPRRLRHDLRAATSCCRRRPAVAAPRVVPAGGRPRPWPASVLAMAFRRWRAGGSAPATTAPPTAPSVAEALAAPSRPGRPDGPARPPGRRSREDGGS